MSTVNEPTQGLTAENLESIGGRTHARLDRGPRRYRWSRKQYMRLADQDFFRGKRVELIGGDILEMSPMNRPHATCVVFLTEIMVRLFSPIDHVRVQMQFDLGPNNQPEPDIAVIQGDPRTLKSHPRTALLIIEVSETSLRLDLGQKAGLYAKAGIADYWVVNLRDSQLVVHRRPEPDPASPGKFHYAEVTIVPADGSVSPLARPEARIAVADILP